MRDISVGKVMEKKNGEYTGKHTSWYYRFEKKDYKPDGRRNIAYKAGFKTKNEADIAGRRAFNIEYGIIQDPLQTKEGKFANMQFECYINNHWWPANNKHWKPSTAEGYRKKLKNNILPKFGNLMLGLIDSEMLQMFFDNLYLNTPMSNTSIDNLRAFMSQIFKYAVNNKHLVDNPMNNVKKPNTRIESNVKKNTQKRDVINDDILEKIFERFPEGTSAHIPLKLCVLAGFRCSEVFGLTWDDIDFSQHCIFIRRQIQRIPKSQIMTTRELELINKYPEIIKFGWYASNPKYESKRIVPMCKELEELLLREKEKQKEYRRILGRKYISYYYTKTEKPSLTKDFDEFNSKKTNDFENGIVNTIGIGYPLDFVNRYEDGEAIIDGATDHASRVIRGEVSKPLIYEDFNVHSLRHTFSSNLRASGKPEHIIQSFMGHNSPNETKTYMHITREEFNTAINSINTTSHINSLANLMKENNISEDLLVEVINTIKNNKKKVGTTNE